MKRFLIPIFIFVVAMILIAGCSSPNESNDIVEKEVVSSNPTQDQSQKDRSTFEQSSPSNSAISKQSSENLGKKINGIDLSNAEKIGSFVDKTIESVGPIYSDIRDDFVTKDYDKLAIDALKLQRYAEDRLDEISLDEQLPNKAILGELSSKDNIIFKKLVNYLINLRYLAESVQKPLSTIKDDPSKVPLSEKETLFEEAIAQSDKTSIIFKVLIESCDEFGADCGQELSVVDVLEKPFKFT